MQQNSKIDGRYVILRPLGEGGMAKVFLAHDEVLERDVALKVLLEQYALDEEFVERFRREAVNAAALSHPNIVQVFDRGETPDGRYYISMEYVPGGTLKDYIVREGSLAPAVAAEVAEQVAEALGVAHEHGVVHRDVKPQNVLVTGSGDVKVADFGIARAAASSEISQTSAVLGTVRYMSPEQAAGKSATPASDFYSLGVVLYEMLTGHPPGEGPGEPGSGIPAVMSALIFRLLAEDPEERYTNAKDLIPDLQRARDDLPPAGGEAQRDAPPAAFSGRVMRAGRRGRRLRRIALAALALVALLGVLGWGALGGSGGGIVGSLKGAPKVTREAAGGLVGKVERLASSETRVPMTKGLTESAARNRLSSVGLGAVVRPRESTEEGTGMVLEQSAPAGEEVRKGSRILLAVGTGPQSARKVGQVVPNLLGRSYSGAVDALKNAGLILGGVREVPSASTPAGEVLDQSPQAGTPANPGTPVYLAVSSGPPTTNGPAKANNASSGNSGNSGSGNSGSGGTAYGGGSGGYGGTGSGSTGLEGTGSGSTTSGNTGSGGTTSESTGYDGGSGSTVPYGGAAQTSPEQTSPEQTYPSSSLQGTSPQGTSPQTTPSTQPSYGESRGFGFSGGGAVSQQYH